MFKIWISNEDSDDTERDFYLILPKAMYSALLAFVSEIETESLGRDRKMQAKHALYEQRKNDKKRTGI